LLESRNITIAIQIPQVNSISAVRVNKNIGDNQPTELLALLQLQLVAFTALNEIGKESGL
jgi:hypothetical protein